MKTFHSDKKVKTKYVNRLLAHAKADNLIQGQGWDGGKGCAVGCTLESYDHSQYEKELGIPEWMARLYDSIFEGLPNKDAKEFAVEFLKAVPVGVDLNPVKWKFCSFILKENIDRVLSLAIDEKLKEQVVSAIRQCLDLHENAIKKGVWDESAARSAESAAWSAARSAESAESAARSAESAARSAERSAESAAWSAESAARSAERSAESAAWSAARSAASAARSAESAAFQRYAEELMRLVKSVKS